MRSSRRRSRQNGDDGGTCWARRTRCSVSSSAQWPVQRAAGSGRMASFKAHLAHLPKALWSSAWRRVDSKGPFASPSTSRRPPGPKSRREATRCRPCWRRLCWRARSIRVGQDKLGRAGAWPTPAVQSVTTLALLRLRFKLTVHGRREKTAARRGGQRAELRAGRRDDCDGRGSSRAARGPRDA